MAAVLELSDYRVPQVENGYTRFANDLLEAIIDYKFTLRQQTIVLAVIRKTYGYNKKVDEISLSQLAEMTNIARPHLCDAINTLVAAKVMVKQAGRNGQMLGINKHFNQWLREDDLHHETVTERVTGVTETVTAKFEVAVTKSVTEVLPKEEQKCYRISNHKRQGKDSKDKNKTLLTDSAKNPADSSSKWWLDQFPEFWNSFAWKNGKPKALQAWQRIGEANKFLPEAELQALAALIVSRASAEAQRRPQLQAANRTPMYAQGWLSQSRWEDEELATWGAYTDDQKQIIDLWNEIMGAKCPAVRDWTQGRAAVCSWAISKRTPAQWRNFFSYAASLPLPDYVNFDWAMRPESLAKIKEGNFEVMA